MALLHHIPRIEMEIRFDVYQVGVLRKHIAYRGLDFTDDPVAERNLGKRKTAVLCGGGSQNCSIGCKFFGVSGICN